MKKIDPSKIAIAAIFMSLVTSVAVSYAEAPPSVSSPFGDTSSSSNTAADEAPPSLGGTSSSSSTDSGTKSTDSGTKSTTTTTKSTSSSSSVVTPPPAPTPSSSTNITPKKLSKTGPELAILVLPSLLAGYFVGKGKKK